MALASPILIAGPPRCGTTMIAGLLYRHGVWVGQARLTRYPGTNSNFGSENISIKRYLKSLYPEYRNWNTPLPDMVNVPDFKDQIESLVNESGPWLVKTSNILMTWRLWKEAWPDAKWILPIRPLENIVDSAMRHPAMKKHGRKRISKYIIALQQRQALVASHSMSNGNTIYFLDVDKLVNNPEEARPLIEFCGLEFDEGIVNNWIDKRIWHA